MIPMRPAGPIRVMLVDDHALVRAAIRQAIVGPDVTVVAEAVSAEEALAKATELRPDVVLVDIDLPGMDGIRLVREMAPRLPSARFVMLTVSSSERDVLAAVRAGAHGYLTKDLTPLALSRAVRGVHEGELAMPRKLAARVVRRLADAPRVGATEEEGDLSSLSSREVDVLGLLAKGLTDREIGASLTISPRTVETHVASILRKLHARNRSEAAGRFRAQA